MKYAATECLFRTMEEDVSFPNINYVNNSNYICMDGPRREGSSQELLLELNSIVKAEEGIRTEELEKDEENFPTTILKPRATTTTTTTTTTTADRGSLNCSAPFNQVEPNQNQDVVSTISNNNLNYTKMCTRSYQAQGKMFDHFRSVERDCIYNREKTEFSDVLFSFKATPQMGLAVYPGQISPVTYAAANSYAAAQSQQLFPPNGYSPNYCLDQAFVQGSNGCPSSPNFSPPFPAMSVNVSMNMTMGYLPPPPPSHSEGGFQHQQHQVQWNSSNSNQSESPPITSSSYSPYGSSSASSSQPQHLCPQPYNTTYSFAADFRGDPPQLEAVRSHWIPTPATASHIIATNVGISGSSSKPYHHSASSLVSSSKHHHSQKTLRPSENSPPHLNGSFSKTNLCRICGKTYARPSTLKTHLRTHSGEKPYRCGECYKSFSQAANLTAHVRTHSGEKPFHCSICNRKFSQSSSVTTHMRTHSGEKPYRCRLCKKAFSDSSTLTKHLRIHSGEKPYQCKLCLLRFSQSGNLNRHMRVHSSSNIHSSNSHHV